MRILKLLNIEKSSFLILALLIVWQLYQLLVALFPHYTAAQSNPLSNLTGNVTQVVDFHLFGVADGSELMPTNLPIKLLGIFSGNMTPRSQAVIVDSAGVEKVYNVGDTIQTAKIVQIQKDQVILNNSGQMQNLSMTEEKLNLAMRG